jgi:hypothetical protein
VLKTLKDEVWCQKYKRPNLAAENPDNKLLPSK